MSVVAPEPTDERDRRDPGEARAGVFLARLTVAPALLLVSWLVVALPLLMAGVFTPLPAIALFVPVAAAVLTFGLRAARPPEARWGTWWAVGGLLAVTVAFCVLQLLTFSEQIVVRRDPASYFNFATWLAGHGSLPIRPALAPFGGADPALSFGSPAFYQRGGVLWPQFMAGTPMILAPVGHLAGSYAMLAAMPVIGALAVLSFGGLTARLVGPRWAPAGALLLALAWPMMMISRSIYSETPALVLMCGGLALTLDAVRANRGLPALLGGLALGLTVLVRIDGLRDVLPVVAYAGLLVGLRRRTGPALFAGLVAGVGAGLLEGYTLSSPYLHYVRGSLVPLLYIGGAVLLVTAVAVVVVRRWGLPDLTRFRLPDLALAAVFAIMAFFAARPSLQTVRRVPHNPDDEANASFIAALQKSLRLPADPYRQYSELSLHWVRWYIGVPAVLLATIGAGLLLRKLLLRRRTDWLLPYAVIAWTTVTTLWRPGITPDHPWASRRLIVVVLPGLLLFALWVMAWAVRSVRRLGYGPQIAGGTAVVGVLMVLAPTVRTSASMAFTPTEQGEVAQARSMCRSFGPRPTVLIIERVTADRFSQLIRGMCDVPSARIRVRPGSDTAASEDVERISEKVVAAGRRPVLLGANAVDVAPYGTARHVYHVSTRRDSSSLVEAPHGTWSLTINVWMAVPVYAG
ncbi:hypothetical protein GCM10023191_085730 [Actinoallomurus oryzae]|uniref:Glycosyltransferase RgtA/B/C/D-like domain-containing protein n=1 Tax=Actinoallomurus oryzae TaxID=502180 RepID=A0ABP8R1A9_9ACTN